VTRRFQNREKANVHAALGDCLEEAAQGIRFPFSRVSSLSTRFNVLSTILGALSRRSMTHSMDKFVYLIVRRHGKGAHLFSF
jgi:hypothetical protein